MSNSDYGLKVTIHDLAGAVKDAVERAHGEYEPKFYEWMQDEIDSHVDDLRTDIKNKLDTDNANTENHVGLDEIESIINDALVDWDVSDSVSDCIQYNHEFIEESNISDFIRDYLDSYDYITSDQVSDVTELEQTIQQMKKDMIRMESELIIINERYIKSIERSITQRIRRASKYVRSIPSRVWSWVPRFTITRKVD